LTTQALPSAAVVKEILTTESSSTILNYSFDLGKICVDFSVETAYSKSVPQGTVNNEKAYMSGQRH